MPDLPGAQSEAPAGAERREILGHLELQRGVEIIGDDRVQGRATKGHLNAEHRLHPGRPVSRGAVIGVELTRQVRLGMHVNAGGQDRIAEALTVFRGELPGAAQQQGGRVGERPRLKILVVDDAGLVAEAAERPPNHGVLLVGTGPDHVRSQAPEELDVGARTVRPAQQAVESHVLRLPEERDDAGEHGGLGRAVFVHDAKAAFPQKVAGDKLIAVVPMEEVDPDGAGEERFPERARQGLPLPGLRAFKSREFLGAAVPGLGDEDREAGFGLVLGNPVIGGAHLAADRGPRVVVDGPEIQRGAGGGASGHDGGAIFAGVVRVPAIEDAAHHGIGDQMIRVRAARRHRPQGHEVTDAPLAPLDEIMVTGAHAIGRIETGHFHAGEVGIVPLPVGVQRAEVAAVEFTQESPEALLRNRIEPDEASHRVELG